MDPLLQSLWNHQCWADAKLLEAVSAHPTAAADTELRALLHHIVMVQRVFLATFLDRPFDLENEKNPPASVEALRPIFQSAHAEGAALLAGLAADGLQRPIALWFFPGFSLPLAEALTQVVLHSQGHRAQCATRLRQLGAATSNSDFILWVKDGKPAPQWST